MGALDNNIILLGCTALNNSLIHHSQDATQGH